MTSLQPLLLAREYGQASQLKQVVKSRADQTLYKNLVFDLYSSRTFSLERGLHHRFFHDRDSISILSLKSKSEAIIHRIALFSLRERRFLWNAEVSFVVITPKCTASASGIAVINNARIIHNGVQTGMIHECIDSIHVVGERILGYFQAFINSELEYCFGEWNKEAALLTRISVPKKEGRFQIVSNENFWVHFYEGQSSLELSVVNLTTNTLKSFVLNEGGDGTTYSSLSIVGTKLFFAKVISLPKKSFSLPNMTVICVFDLYAEQFLKKVICKECTVRVPRLIANEVYAVWLDVKKNYMSVKCLNLKDWTIETVQEIVSSSERSLLLSLQGKMLSVTREVVRGDGTKEIVWLKEMFDLATRAFISFTEYSKTSEGNYTQTDDVIAITGTLDGEARLYIEDLSVNHGSKDKVTFRINSLGNLD